MTEQSVQPVHQRPARRKRSRLSERDCMKALREFALRVDRMLETSAGLPGQQFAPDDRVTVMFQVVGKFGVAADLMEAMRVLAGYKLPRRSNARK